MVLEGDQLLPERERLIVALDVGDEAAALALVDRLAEEVSCFKVGLQLFTACGPSIVKRLWERGARVFLDLKLHDIPNTVAHAIDSCMQQGVFLIDVHATGGRAMLTAAAESAREGAARKGVLPPKIIGVTLLTHLHAKDFPDIGLSSEGDDVVTPHVVRLSRLCQECGLDGVVASSQEVKAIREETGPGFLIVTPGIRPAGGELHDQTRVATPARALRAGASYLVVGRPITAAADPKDAARQIIREMEDAFLIA
ncbi:MAG: orotidine-5'-phosphate decarboxylase [Armatimonadetes bacterium]|nr:orotidine-5'-phosphate decarboxylase [Armatimonadota bacterium]